MFHCVVQFWGCYSSKGIMESGEEISKEINDTQNVSIDMEGLIAFHLIFNENGDEVAIFDDELVTEGCKKWKMTVCGYFVGTQMSIYKVRYNVRRLLGRFGLGKMFMNGNGFYFFKFKNMEGVQYECGFKLKNVPMEAWTKKGISVLASHLGRPIIMDAMTTMMCNQGAERTKDGLKQNKGRRKEVLDRTEFEEIRNKKKGNYINNLKKNSVEVQYRPKVNVKKDILKENTSKADMRNRNEENRNRVQKEDVNKGETEDGKKSESMKTRARKNANGKWNVNQNVMDFVKVSANKYVVLQEGYDEDFPPYISPIKQTEVDKYLKYKRKPTKEDTKEWNESEFLKENELRNEGKNDQRRIRVMKVQISKQAMMCLIEDVDQNFRLFYTFIYASNNGRKRRELWKNLMVHKYITYVKPWGMMGDFNVTLKINVHNDGMSHSNIDMQEFQKCVEDVKMEDLNSSGFHFTWTKSLLNENSSTMKKLDRVMGNEKFVEEYNQAYALFLPYLVSDHSPALLVIPHKMEMKVRSSSFSNFIATNKEFLPLVKKEWDVDIVGYKMYILVKKLKKLKYHLNKLSWKDDNVLQRVANLKNKLSHVQNQLDKDCHNNSLSIKVAQVLKDYNEAVKDEENMLYQLAKVDWLKEGDKNTTYFHQVVKGRRHKNHIDVVCDEQRRRFEGNEVSNQFVKNFQMFLGASRSMKEIDNIEELSPGPDGCTSKFYKAAWLVAGKEVEEAIQEFFQKGKLLNEINVTLITLVPKVKSSMKVSEYRPIACCNVFYKIISKILTNRLKFVLCRIISKNQSAFIPQRSITDNIMITQELLKSYGIKNGKSRCAFKIDIMKEYDIVNWDFLESIMRGFRFPNNFIRWVMTYVRSSAFLVSLNGERFRYFKGGRRLRQGDPMSPYLFTIVMEMLNLILERKINQTKRFTYHHRCEELKITNLCFVDDLLILSNGDVNYVSVIREALEEFSDVSGLYPNLSKSVMFCSNVNEETKEVILQTVSFTIGKLPVRYLGVPLITKKLSPTDCKSLIERVKGKINDWKNKFMSYAGRLKRKNLWEADYDCNASYGWRKLLDLKRVGPISSFISRRQMYNARIDCNINVAGMIENGQWRWTSEWYDQFQELKEIKVPTIDEHKQDSEMWLGNEQKVVKYSINRMRADVGNQGSQVDWHDVVWLPTQDRLAKWYPNKVMNCALCSQGQDSHQHLFFQCPYSKQVWNKAKLKADMNIGSCNWKENMEYIKDLPSTKNIWTVVKKLKVKRTEEDLWKVIEGNINMKLSGLRVTESSCVREKEWKFMDCLIGSVDMVGEVSIGPSYHLYVGIPIGTEVLPRLDDASYKSLCGSGCEHRQGVCM
ncbi:RNA-directed DNA polymerase, eukaryota, reverse transcriptase zinc-binding domain protein [Tanacetum coccineum]